ncbi:MAG: methyltransferase domain-containing protein [Hyphomicrobiales bacterium]|nr:methyltransferase domain-containing protein [Hyphomicrobiales bacterium]MDE2115668.1 class I SAM-dependent methyltransferase [Hyphomicrobiales bacterium]
MSQLFDAYEDNYGAAVQSSIDFSGLPHDFFLIAKADLLAKITRAHFGGGAKLAGLDVGCGIGALHPLLGSTFTNLHGVDVSKPCIDQARRANAAVTYAAHDGETLPYADGKFDVTMTSCVMHHVPPAQWQAFMAEMARVTRPGGLVCVIEHNPWNPLTRLAVARCEFDRDAVLLTAPRTQKLMVSAGLGSVASDFFLFLPTAAAPARKLEGWLKRLPLGAQYMTTGVR